MAKATTRSAHRKTSGSAGVRGEQAQVLTERRVRLLDQARSEGLIGSSKDARISGRVPGSLIDAAKRRAHLSSDTDLIEFALLTVALQDDFGERLLRRKGSIPADIDLEH